MKKKEKLRTQCGEGGRLLSVVAIWACSDILICVLGRPMVKTKTISNGILSVGSDIMI